MLKLGGLNNAFILEKLRLTERSRGADSLVFLSAISKRTDRGYQSG